MASGLADITHVYLHVDVVEVQGTFPVFHENVPELVTHRVLGQDAFRIFGFIDINPLPLVPELLVQNAEQLGIPVKV